MKPGGDRTLPSSLSYDQSKRLARDDDPAVRQAVAVHPDVKPEVLYYLAEDSDPTVRRQVAGNDRTPRQADLILARDEQPDVRLDLARKIARLLPDMTPDDQDAVYRAAVSVLEVLCEDQLVRVRQLIADAVKSLPAAPHHVVMRLAQDQEPRVSSPVLEVSPVLSDEDLLEIIGTEPVQQALEAISRRNGLSESVSSAIVDTGERAAIASLLANKSAQIREETLDYVASQAADVPAWHAPLVRRPSLSARVANRIAGFVARALLVELSERQDLAPEVLESIEETVSQRLNETETPEDEGFEPDWAGSDEVGEKVRAMQADGSLDAAAIETALEADDKPFVMRALATLAGLDADVVAKVVANRSPKGMLALAWKASLSAHLAAQLQTRLGGLQNAEVLYPTDDGGYPIPEDGLEWQLEFFRDL